MGNPLLAAAEMIMRRPVAEILPKQTIDPNDARRPDMEMKPRALTAPWHWSVLFYEVSKNWVVDANLRYRQPF